MENENEDYNTLSGEITEDTLSFTERRKLKEKRGKLTEEEQMKLHLDDTYGGFRSTWGNQKKDREVYNPNVEYFFVSYYLNEGTIEDERVRWVRGYYLTRHQVLPILRHMLDNYEMYHNFEILSEKGLDQKSKYICDDGVERELTLREVRFGSSYQHTSDKMKEDPEMWGSPSGRFS